MAGHSHWAGIKHKKGVTDAKRGKLFSKLLKAIAAAARGEPNPDFNPRLRTAIQKAREASVPADTIERALERSLQSDELEELTFEAYGPEGSAIIIEAISDNRNRTVAEVKKILSDFGGKWAESGSVRWGFEHDASTNDWVSKFPQQLGDEDASKLRELLSALHEHDDVQKIYTNAGL